MNKTLIGFGVSLLFVGKLSAAPNVDYAGDIKPILSQHCHRCHGPLKQESNLRLDTAALMLKGGEQGPALVAGKSSQSLLIEAVVGSDDLQMPPKGEEPLSEKQIALLKAWIDQGAKAPEEIAVDPSKHWAFKLPKRPPLPQVTAAEWSRNPIDAFIAAEHAKRKLQPRGLAPKHVLLRRIYLDLIGLPPTRKQLNEFLADNSHDAYEKVVDQLLASKQHGERWGRHWLDVWRYSDWYGFQQEIRHSHKHVWRWRDWVVDSVNADKGYDRMIVEMLAADELTPFDPANLAATGFLVRNRDTDSREKWMVETVEYTAKAFLGLTVGCARCHDHMYDPISQTEYYRFRSIFEPYNVRIDEFPGAGGTARAYDQRPGAVTKFYIRGNDRNPDKEKKITPGVPQFLGGKWNPPQGVSMPPLARVPALRPAVQQATVADFHKRIEDARAEVERMQQAILAVNSPTKKPGPTKKPVVKKTSSTFTGDVFLDDDFKAARPIVWKTGPGKWEYRDGNLLQREVGGTDFRWIQTLTDHPQDFSVELRFKTTGGVQYRSVGLRFDVGATHGHGVFLTANDVAPALAFFDDVGGQRFYRGNLRKSRPVKLNTEMLLRLDVRGPLVNVFVDGQLQQAFRLSTERKKGKFELFAVDAAAEFISVRLGKLAIDAELEESVSCGGLLDTSTAEGRKAKQQKLETSLSLARRQLVSLQNQLLSFQATAAAENFRYSTPAPKEDATKEVKEKYEADKNKLFTAAQLAQRESAAASAEEALAAAELELTKARECLIPSDEKLKKAVADAEKKVAAADKKLAASVKAKSEPATAKYTGFPGVYSGSSGRRLALARWIANRDNPLTARVAVNQLWMRHFGRPLVASVFDFGMAGNPPSHGELLDWLAVEFTNPSLRISREENAVRWKNDKTSARPWSMKHIHRLLVTSRAYRSDSTPSKANSAIDPDNKYYWRMAPRRMEAELVRDSVLYVAGQLDLTLGGEEIPCAEGMTVRRRSLYFRHTPEQQMTFLKLFDVASPTECYRRTVSIVPHQALALVNSELTLRQARLLARRLAREKPEAIAFVRAAFEQILSRPASDEDLRICLGFLKQQEAFYTKNADRLTNVAKKPTDGQLPSAEPSLRAKELLIHSLLNHHDFVTIR